MTREQRQGILAVLAIMYAAASIMCLVGGISEADTEDCEAPVRRIEILIPTYQIGCWLGSPIFHTHRTE